MREETRNLDTVRGKPCMISSTRKDVTFRLEVVALPQYRLKIRCADEGSIYMSLEEFRGEAV